jgi:hypothetical protein
MTVRLGVIVPYRDRAGHLAAFVPHLRNFFHYSAMNAELAVRILIVEQSKGLPFNRGMLKNVGFRELAPFVDAVCFHDVDLLPVSADYRPSNQPAMLISEGLSFTPEMIRKLFGGVVLMDATQFAQANGFSNRYWGWGFEDVDLRERLLRGGCTIAYREGSFTRLPHLDEGSLGDGSPTADHIRNRAHYVDLWFSRIGTGYFRKRHTDEFWKRDGLSSLSIQVIRPRLRIDDATETLIVERIVVESKEC